MVRLPDSEFTIMKVIWSNTPPITTALLMNKIGKHKGIKTPTMISYLQRLQQKGFIRCEKQGKELQYYPLVDKETYLKSETVNFMHNYHDDSLASLFSSMDKEKGLTDSDFEMLEKILERRKK